MNGFFIYFILFTGEHEQHLLGVRAVVDVHVVNDALVGNAAHGLEASLAPSHECLGREEVELAKESLGVLLKKEKSERP